MVTARPRRHTEEVGRKLGVVEVDSVLVQDNSFIVVSEHNLGLIADAC